MPGMYIKARIEVTSEETLAVPESAVVNFEGTYYVFATADNKNFRMTEVTTGNATEGFVTIHFVEGTIPERIVLKGAYELLSKMKNTEED
jgi:cobalt-zinc-cadmium efflux system membrane fusion protein